MRKSCAFFWGVLLGIWMVTTGFAADWLDGCSAKGAVLLDGGSGRVLAGKEIHTPLPNASTTKILTAYLTLQEKNLDAPFVVDQDAIHVEGSSMGLQEGDVVTLRALAWGMLIASGNDAANAAAVRIAGSVPAFVARMNAQVDAWGLENAHFVTPSGLDAQGHQISAHDLAAITRYAMQDEEFCRIVRSPSATLYYGNPPYRRTLYNHNRLLQEYDRCVGVKTGFTDAAYRCLVTAAEQEGKTLVMVTLNCADDFPLHRSTYERCFEELRWCSLENAFRGLTLPVTGGEGVPLPVVAATAPGVWLLPEEMGHCKLSFSLPSFGYAPIAAGAPLGEAIVSVGETEVARIQLAAGGAIGDENATDTRSILQRIKDFFAAPHQYELEAAKQS